jgi:nitrite reductase/ring-hydroxylating ferredoxin subunit
LFFLDKLPATAWMLGSFLFLIGMLTYAPDSLISGTAAVDFGTKKGASTASGLINGAGSVGAVVGGTLPGLVQKQWGWQGVFTVLAAACCCSRHCCCCPSGMRCPPGGREEKGKIILTALTIALRFKRFRPHKTAHCERMPRWFTLSPFREHADCDRTTHCPLPSPAGRCRASSILMKRFSATMSPASGAPAGSSPGIRAKFHDLEIYFTLEVDIGSPSSIARNDDRRRIHGFHNVCRHRGSMLCPEPAGHVARLVCPYHQWTYGMDGRLLAVAACRRTWTSRSFGLARVHVREVEG